MMKQVSTRVVAEILRDKSQKNNVFIDVREKDEHAQASVEGFTLISLNEEAFENKVEQLLQNKIKQEALKQGDTLDVYMMCRGGMRSAKACHICSECLEEDINGVNINYNNVIGGIMSWLSENN